jgi:DNA-binding transcriptional MerR regulator
VESALRLAALSEILRMGQLSIGEVARRTGLTVETLRYYEYLGLLPTVARTRGGSRRYAAEIIPHLQFIKHAQTLGLSLRDIQMMTGAKQRDSRETCRQVREILARQLAFVNERLTELNEAQQTLTTYLSACEQALNTPDEPVCPVLAGHQAQPSVIASCCGAAPSS